MPRRLPTLWFSLRSVSMPTLWTVVCCCFPPSRRAVDHASGASRLPTFLERSRVSLAGTSSLTWWAESRARRVCVYTRKVPGERQRSSQAADSRFSLLRRESRGWVGVGFDGTVGSFHAGDDTRPARPPLSVRPFPVCLHAPGGIGVILAAGYNGRHSLFSSHAFRTGPSKTRAPLTRHGRASLGSKGSDNERAFHGVVAAKPFLGSRDLLPCRDPRAPASAARWCTDLPQQASSTAVALGPSDITP